MSGQNAQTPVDVRAIMARDALDACIRRQWDDLSYAEQCAAESDHAAIALAELIAERDALREVLREFQDGRRYSNPHTRQVARDIERTALERAGGAP